MALFQKNVLKQKGILNPETRNRIQDYTPYLRVFDGDLAGFTVAEIVSELFADIENEYPNYLANKRVRNILTKSKKLVNSGYRLLARM